MVHQIVLGRRSSEIEKWGTDAAILIGKQYITMGKNVSMANEVLMDVNRPHLVLIAGKRGSGKSYTMGVLAEGMTSLPKKIADNLGILIFDTMGIYWTMKYPNLRDEELLSKWGLKPEGFADKVKVYVPEGKYKEAVKNGLPVDKPFSIKTSELTANDWLITLGVDPLSPIGITVTRTVSRLKEKGDDYGVEDIISMIQDDSRAERTEKDAAENLFQSVKSWGLFSKHGTRISEIVKRGEVSVLDISMYAGASGTWSVRALVIGLISLKLLEERMKSRKLEELQSIEKGWSLFEDEATLKKEHVPLVWLFIDEAHEFLPAEGKTPASTALITVIREGRQPGVSAVLATQQPGKIHSDVITQSDLVISHRLTAKRDVDSLGAIMQSYLASGLIGYLNALPKMRGSAVVLDDKLERVYPIQIRPRFTWHGGSEPQAIPIIKKI
ncbi:MAG: ATP-binding protein [Nanoarchaeota archaeon]|nr:ATP-binding protein [Nanoarchaeota archaeon]